MPPWRLVRRVRTTRYITGHAVSARFGLIRAGGGVRQPLPSSRERGKIPPTLNNQSDGHPAGHAPPPPGPSRQNSAPHHGKRGVRSIWFCSSRGGRALAASTLARDKAKKIPPTHNNQSEGRPAGHAPPPLGLSRQNHAPHHGRRGVCSIWFCSSRGGRAAAASTLSRNKAKKIPPTLNNDSCLPIYKTIPAICNTLLQTQCVWNSIFPHLIIVIQCSCGPSCGLWLCVGT